MSYARFSEHSDVYVYEDVAGGFTVHVRKNDGYDDFNYKSRAGLLVQLYSLRARQFRVPEFAIERLRAEIAGGAL